MNPYINYEGKRIKFSLPRGWVSMVHEDRPPVPAVADLSKEIRHALDHPIGSPRIEELARPGMDVVLLFDDLQRPTPAHVAIPEIMDRLNRAGIPDERITGICAVGTHPIPTMDQLNIKVGNEAFTRLNDRLISHDPHSKDNIIIGRTHRGTIVQVNQRVAFADLIIGLGECMPHPVAGFGGGCKIIMPGVCSYRSVADHHFTWMRHRNSRVNLLDGNPFYEESVDGGRLSRLAFKLDLIINEKKEVIKEKSEKFTVFHVTEGLTAEQVATMRFSYCPDLQEAINRISETMPKADVAIFPSGGTIIPEVQQ